MCGIAGFVNATNLQETQREYIDGMIASMIHRGPDEQGSWVENPVALANCRLSIIDLAGGHQPMMDENETAAVVFNGEIYNFPELRENLRQKGYRFRTRCDTEVLLYSYLDQGYDCLRSIVGMFAFAIWDKRTGTLFAARDPLGKKPFYYTLQNGVFAFASELNALRCLPFLKLEVSRKSIARFLSYEYVPTPDTIYSNVFKLRPGHFLTFSNGRVKTAPYWEVPAPESAGGYSERDCLDRILDLSKTAVKRRLISDVPLGVLLSGGIDSSAIVALLRQDLAGDSIKTFSIRLAESSFDESPFARAVSRYFGTDHYEETLSAEHAWGLIPEIVAKIDEPIADPSLVPTYFLSQVTRKKVTVALGGDGGDELFAGYEWFSAYKLADYYLRLPAVMRSRFFERLTRYLPNTTSYSNPRYTMRRFLNGAAAPPWLRAQVWQGAFMPGLQDGLWLEPPNGLLEPESIFSETRSLFEGFGAEFPMDKVLFVSTRQFLLDYILVKVDRCSMLHSLEVRAPFLDRDLVDFVFRLPSDVRLPGFRRKYLLKKALKDLLPREILTRKKRGFLIPTALWLKTDLKPLVEEMLGEDHLRRQGLFNPRFVRNLINEHNTGKEDHRRELWTLLILQLWLHLHNPAIA